MKYKFLITLLIITIKTSFAQTTNIQWQKCLGGTKDDWAYSIKQTTDGGYIVAGGALSYDGDVTGNHQGSLSSPCMNSDDAWVVKLNNAGNIEWKKSLGGTCGEIAYSIQQTLDGGYIIAAITLSGDGDVSGSNNHGRFNYWIVKLNSVGTIQWQKCFGGTLEDFPYSIQQTTDGGYIIAGQTASNDGDVSGNHGGDHDMWVIKLNSTGALQWQKCLGGSGDDVAYSTQQTSDGGYIIAGYTASVNGDVSGSHNTSNGTYPADAWIVKLTSNGNIQWQKCIGGSDDDRARFIQQTNDGGYIIAGQTSSSDGDLSAITTTGGYWIIKINSAGAIEWQKNLGGNDLGGSIATFIQQTNNGYIVAGETSSFNGDVTGNHGGRDFWIVKLNNSGTLQWQKCLGGSGFEDSGDAMFLQPMQRQEIHQTTDGGYIVAGATQSHDGDVTGNHSNVGFYDYWVIKLSPELLTDVDEKQNTITISIYPNPSQTQLFLSEKLKTIEVYDFNGKLLMIEKESGMLNVKNLSTGTYMLKGITMQGDNIETKFIKQ